MSKDKKYIYEVVEENENPLETKMVKRGVEVEFTMQQMDDYSSAALRTLDQYRGQLNLEDAKMKNVVENHEDAVTLVKDLDPVKQNAIRIWLNSKAMIDEMAPKRDELEEALKEHKQEIKDIIKQTGWKAISDEAKEADSQEDN